MHFLIGKQIAFLERALDRLPQRFHRLFRVHLGDAVELRFEAALQEEIGQALDQFLQVHAVGRFARVLRVADVFQS